jgi:formylmethanofuran dehydrogenase subunit E
VNAVAYVPAVQTSEAFLRRLADAQGDRARGWVLDCSECGEDCDAESVDLYGVPLCRECLEK